MRPPAQSPVARRAAEALIVVALPALLLGTCVAPAPLKQTKSPRPGLAVGGRVAVVYSKHYQINLAGLERLHPFDIHKYARIYLDLNRRGLIRPPDVFVPEPLTERQIRRVHTQTFLDSLKDSRNVSRYLEAGAIGYAPTALVEAGILAAFRSAAGGTVLAAREALACGVAINLGGGYHHAKPDAGEGFNVYADLAIAIRQLQQEGLVGRVCVIDLDVHQGNGTAEIFAGDDTVYTFSMHQRDIYPIPKAHSDRDVELQAGTGDGPYLDVLSEHLPAVLDQARPDLVLYQGGCDTLADDPLAGLAMTPAGVARRDAMVIDACVRRGIPVAMTLGGGYGPSACRAQADSIAAILAAHGLAGRDRAYPPRNATIHERLYVK